MMFCQSRRGVVTVEFALILPVLLAVAYFSVDVVRISRAESRLHRATAVLADAIANQHLDDDVALPTVIPGNMGAALDMLGEMLGDDDASRIGVSVTYFDSTTMGAPVPLLSVYSNGIPAGDSGAPDLQTLCASGLVTDFNGAQAELVLVECAYDMPKDMFLSAMIYPDKFTSYFVTLRKQWRPS